MTLSYTVHVRDDDDDKEEFLVDVKDLDQELEVTFGGADNN